MGVVKSYVKFGLNQGGLAVAQWCGFYPESRKRP
jgi:hypothetical protein